MAILVVVVVVFAHMSSVQTKTESCLDGVPGGGDIPLDIKILVRHCRKLTGQVVKLIGKKRAVPDGYFESYTSYGNTGTQAT